MENIKLLSKDLLTTIKGELIQETDYFYSVKLKQGYARCFYKDEFLKIN